MITLEEVKGFLRVDGDHEDGVIDSLIKAAKTELKLSGVSPRNENDPDFPLYELAVKVLVTQNYENRGIEKVDNRVLETMILKLKDFSVGESHE